MEDSSQLLSLPSQPPDIRIWFPSYEYESPESDLDEDFSASNEECPAKGRACQMSDQDSEPKSCAVSDKGTHSPSIKSLPHLTSILLSRKTDEDDKPVQNFSSHKCNQIAEAGNLDEFHERKIGGGDDFVSKTGGASNKDEEVGVKRLESNLSEAADISVNVEEEGKATIANDGFRSTKSKKSATENPGMMINASKAIPRQALATNARKIRAEKCTSDLVVQENEEVSAENHGRAGRMALLDRTNLCSNEMTPEIRGRWKCPQKGKPYIGPPLKQLRLECWARRVD